MSPLPTPPAAPVAGETCPGLSTFDLPAPYRPGTADFNGAELQNASGADGDAPPPEGDGSMPTAALLNTWSLLIIALGKMIPVARVSLTASSSAPFLSFAHGAASWVTPAAFVVTRNAAGDYSITYAQPLGTTTWAGATPYTGGAFILPPVYTGFYYECTSSGTSGTSAPLFPVTVGSTVADGTGSLVWTCWGQINQLPPPASWPSHELNLPGGVAASQEYAISSVGIQNGVRVTTSQNGTLADLNFSVNIY